MGCRKVMNFTNEAKEIEDATKKDGYKTVTSWVNSLVFRRIKRLKK